MSEPLLTVEDLHVKYKRGGGFVHAVRGVSYAVAPGERIALVGESGSGKTTTGLATARLLPTNAELSGHMWFEGVDILALREREMQKIRGRRIGVIYQDPFTALNPVHRIGRQIAEAQPTGRLFQRRAAQEDVATRLLTRVGVPDARRRVREYPHQFSGGMRQRAMIAMSIASGPRLLVADEPTTALDVTVQAQIMEMLEKLTIEEDLALLLITHDLGSVARIAHRVYVMYAGHIVESGTAVAIFETPAHPYTIGLLESLPRLEAKARRLHSIKGNPPDLGELEAGCPFEPRCKYATAECAVSRPTLQTLGTSNLGRDAIAPSATNQKYELATGSDAPHLAACWHPQLSHAASETSNADALYGPPS